MSYFYYEKCPVCGAPAGPGYAIVDGKEYTFGLCQNSGCGTRGPPVLNNNIKAGERAKELWDQRASQTQ